jgi:hypothetical protein
MGTFSRINRADIPEFLLMMIMKMMMERRILLENVTCGELPLLL